MNAMTIVATILQARAQQRRMDNPTTLYLGHKERAALKSWAEAEATFCVELPEKPTRPKFYGMQIFEVDAESHLDFGYKKPTTQP